MQFKTYFSYDLIHFESLEKSKYKHYYGGLVTVNDTLIAIGGYSNRKVEVLEKKWKKIKPVPSRAQHSTECRTVCSALCAKCSARNLYSFSTLVINNTIYVFGKLIYCLLAIHGISKWGKSNLNFDFDRKENKVVLADQSDDQCSD